MIELIRKVNQIGDCFRNRRPPAANDTTQRGPRSRCATLLFFLTNPTRSVPRWRGGAGSWDRGRRLHAWIGDGLAVMLTWAYRRQCAKMFPTAPKPEARAPAARFTDIRVEAVAQQQPDIEGTVIAASTMLVQCLSSRYNEDEIPARLVAYGCLRETAALEKVFTAIGAALIEDFVTRRN